MSHKAFTMRPMKPSTIRSRLSDWARCAGVSCTRGYCDTPSNNVPWLSAETRAEFEKADGNEFGHAGSFPKIAALHSSSALAVNVFDYWRNRKKAPLAAALGYGGRDIVCLTFERKYRTGVGPRSPNIDVVLKFEGGATLAIESKFTEWTGHAGRKALRPTYLAPGAKRWASKGLPGAQRAAEACVDGMGFDRLDVPQLLKHMLGLATEKSGGNWKLLLLWYRYDEKIAAEMDAEITRFTSLLGSDADRFAALTYQDLWGRLAPNLDGEHSQYAAYLSARYFT